jgi:hypothetical protein
MNSDYRIQSVLIDNRKYNLQEAVDFLVKNNFKYSKVDKTLNFWRFRQFEPAELRRKGFNTYINKKLNNGIGYIIAYKN